jgi:Rieske 2Fe-2S family protein
MFSQENSAPATPDRQPAATTAPPIRQPDLDAALRPFGHSRMLPPEAYTSEDVFRWEQRNFFSGWQCVARSAEVAGPGAQLSTKVGATSMVLARDEQGTLRGFANFCPHRGHELLPCPGSAKRRSLICPYHAWSFNLAGQLQAAPGYRELADFNPEENGLRQLRTEERFGYVFVDPSGQGPELDEYLGGLGDILAKYRTAELVVQVRHEYVVKANWKVIIENYAECYHCPPVHPELCRVSPPESGETWHSDGAWIGGWMDLRPEAETMSFDGRSLGVPIEGLPAPWDRRVDYLAVFPNLLVSGHPDYVMTHRAVPLSAGETWIECAWAFPAAAAERPGFDPAYAADFWDLTNRQDWAACESVQRGLSSGLASAGTLSPAEDSVYEFVTMVARGYAGLPAHQHPEAPNQGQTRDQSEGASR